MYGMKFETVARKNSLPDLCLKTGKGGGGQHMKMTLERKVIETPPH